MTCADCHCNSLASSAVVALVLRAQSKQNPVGQKREAFTNAVLRKAVGSTLQFRAAYQTSHNVFV